ncbi:MAG TPA: hypothetical protein VL651_04050 [Bacteroidia bacterium]|jgi:Flp pilus assembly protein TadB|nr:hypothetical protein [Bacteroidia bacterium]
MNEEVIKPESLIRSLDSFEQLCRRRKRGKTELDGDALNRLFADIKDSLISYGRQSKDIQILKVVQDLNLPSGKFIRVQNKFPIIFVFIFVAVASVCFMYLWFTILIIFPFLFLLALPFVLIRYRIVQRRNREFDQLADSISNVRAIVINSLT